MHIQDSDKRAMNGADNVTLRSQVYPIQHNALPLPLPGGVLRALVLYEDPDCLDILADMLEDCRYQVTRCSSFDNAWRMLMQNRDGFDIFLSNAVVDGVDGFNRLRVVSKEMDIPVIVMAIEDHAPATIRYIFHGFCDYLVGSNKKELFRGLLGHVHRRRKCTSEDPAQTGGSSNGNGRRQEALENPDIASFESEEKLKEEKEATTCLLKKKRVVWDSPLHQRFVSAVDQLGGVNRASPKRILEMMAVDWLTKDNVTSHLQKYREKVRRETKAKESRKKSQVPKSVPGNVQEHPVNEIPDINLSSWTPQHPMMNGDEWFLNMNMYVQMAQLHQPTEPVIAGNGGQLNFSDWVAEISTQLPPPPPPPPPPDFPVSSYSAIQMEESSFGYNVSDLGHREWELGNIIGGFEPENVILQPPPPPSLPPDFPVSSYSAMRSEESSFGYNVSDLGHREWELGNIHDGFPRI